MQDFGDSVILPGKLMIANVWDSQRARLASRVCLTEEGFFITYSSLQFEHICLNFAA